MTVLRELFKRYKIEEVVEFGMGLFSTPFFLERCNEVLSVEMQSEKWYNLIYSKYGDRTSWHPVKFIHPYHAIDWMQEAKFDLCFVDGHINSRPECINLACAPIIVAHDTECQAYGWQRVSLPEGYKEIKHTKQTPHTTVWIDEGKVKGGIL